MLILVVMIAIGPLFPARKGDAYMQFDSKTIGEQRLFDKGKDKVAKDSSKAKFFIVWGIKGGGFHGQLSIENGEFTAVEPWQWEPADVLNADDKRHISWIGNVYSGTDGLQFMATGSMRTTFRLRFTVPYKVDATLTWQDVSQGEGKIIPLGREHDFVAYGSGDIRRGPRKCRSVSLPSVFEPPAVPQENVTDLPDDWFEHKSSVSIFLSKKVAGEIIARRVSKNSGRLYLKIYCKEGPLTGRADINYAGIRLASVELDGSLWLSLTPRIDTLDVNVDQSDAKTSLNIPTTLVEVRGSKLFVNGEPFLVKGTLPRDLNDEDAAYLKSLGANTLRLEPGKQFQYLHRHGFMAIASCHSGPGKLCEKAGAEEEFREGIAEYLKRSLPMARQAAGNLHTLLIQLGNEQVTGQDPWLYRFRPPHSFERLDYLLTELYNAVKPLDPMLPLGYSNCAFGYIAPDFLNVYLHNTYLDNDRNWPPLEEFMALQGCDRRPYIHTEFGANVYMPQVHLHGPNSPVLEKIHAWNYPNRWNTYLAAGTIGGTNYCLYDYDYSKVNPNSWDRGFTNFGIMTFDRKPKLACWELWHLWRDFEVSPDKKGALRIGYKREYPARNCRLTIRTQTGRKTIDLGDFPPDSVRSFSTPIETDSFRWQIDYTTHGGLPMMATGAYPESMEAEDFLERLKSRDTYPFLRELLDAEVITTDGQPAPPTLKEMEREDGIVPIAFRKPNGVVYLTVFTRKQPEKGIYEEGVDLDLAFNGVITAVDELTGQPKDAPVEVERVTNGLRLKNVRAPYLPAQYTNRSKTPITLPVFRITPK